jgi:hypothetical protein
MCMAWDSTRPVPWRRLIREWIIYVAFATVAFLFIYRHDLKLGLFAGLFASGPMYLLFGAVLAKFGYARKTFKDLRTEREAVAAAKAASPNVTSTGRPKPAPTRRTSSGPSSQRKGSKPKRR